MNSDSELRMISITLGVIAGILFMFTYQVVVCLRRIVRAFESIAGAFRCAMAVDAMGRKREGKEGGVGEK